MMMIGKERSFISTRTLRTNSSPSILGIRMSVSTRSDLSVWSFSSASWPSMASVMLAWVIPSTLVRDMHRSCLKVAESSTTSRDFLDIRASLCHSQQTHESFHGSEFSICHAVQLRADQGAGGMSGKQLEKLVIELGEFLLVRKQRVNRDHADYPVLDLQRDARTRFFARVVAEEGLAMSRNTAFDSLSAHYARFLGATGSFSLVAGAHKLMCFVVEHKWTEVLRTDHVEKDLFDAFDDLGRIQRRVQPMAGHVEVGEAFVLLLDFHVSLRKDLVL